MQSRYALRFENGERKGETVPITGNGVTVGRKPGNSVQVLDASVSGKHAEFIVEAGGVVLRDLGSTNGTRVGNARVSEQRLAHGDQVWLGNVRVSLLDTTLGELPAVEPEPESAAAANPQAGDEVHAISAEKVAKSGSRSLIGALALVVVLGAGYGAWWYLQRDGGGTTATSRRAVEALPGNLLAGGYSFEGDNSGWVGDDAAPQAFAVDGASRRSGENGFGAVVAGDEWALARSASVRPGSARAFVARAWVRVDGAAQARLGVELEQASNQAARTVAWSRSVAATSEFEELELSLAVPACYDSVRVILLARSTGADRGSVDVDDVALLAAADVQGVDSLDEFQLFRLGVPATAAALFKIDRTLFSDFHARTGDGATAERVELGAEKRDNGFALALGSGAGRTLSLRIDEPLLKGGLATIGSGGYLAHGTEFTREGASGLIAGAGKDLVRIAFDQPVKLRGRPDGTGFRVDVELGPNEGGFLQLAFRSERDEAQTLARSAREADKAGKLGECAALWGRLRDEYPFEAPLLAESEATRGRIAEKGLAEVSAQAREVERARFFRLVELYRKCKRDAAAIVERYKGSEVEQGARALITQIDGELVALESELDRTERGRLEAIARALEGSGSAKLAARVREYLAEHVAHASDRSGGGR